MRQREQALLLIKKAAEDEALLAEILSSRQISDEIFGFHCQQAAEKLAEAGHIIGKEPVALHLRLFQTMSDIAVEKNSTIILPIPTELLEYLGKTGKK